MPPNIDMIGEQDLEAMELQMGHGHVVYTGGAKGTDELVEQLGKQFGMQVEVLVPPNHPRATFIAPSTVEVLMLANPHLHQAAEKLGKQMPSHFYTLQLLQRNYQIAKKAHTIYAFGILEQDHKRVKGGTGWTVQLAMDQGKPVYLFDIPSQSWYRSDHYYQVNENAATLVTGSQFVPWLSWDPGMWTTKPEPKFKPYSTARSVYPRTLINYVWNSKTFICNVLVFIFSICT